MSGIRLKILLGLALMLIVLVVYRLVKSPSRTGTAPDAVGRIERESKPTPMRVLNPDDLEVVESLLKTSKEDKTAGSLPAHRLLIRNKGKVTYSNVNFEIRYLDSSGKVLTSRRHVIEGPILPGSTIMAGELLHLEIPEKSRSAAVRILFSDMGGATERAAPPQR